MANSEIIRRNSYDHLRSLNNNQSESSYVCDCGQEYMTEETLKRHQQTNCKNRSVQCSFCNETFSSSLIRDHLLSCGNKTDECPRCHHFIRRSHFAYHYENNCASTDDIETPPTRPKSRSAQQHVLTNSNKPILRVDIPSDEYPENYSGQNSLTNSPRGNRRSPLSISNSINISMTIECEFCHNRCVRTDYKTHREKCLDNPANINRKQPSVIPSRSNQNQGASHGIVHIPCEICQQLIDLPNWSSHTQNCREREKQRVERRAETMSQQPVTEQFPCEYCHQLFLAKQLHLHERNCLKNPDNTESARLLAQRRTPSTVVLPIKRQNDRTNPIPSNARSPNNNRFAQYQRIDIDRTHIANRSLDNNISQNINNTNQNYLRNTASDENFLKSKNSPRHGHTYENESMRSNENISQLSRERPSNGVSQRAKSSDSLRNMYDNQDRSNNNTDYRSPYQNDRRHQHQIHHGNDFFFSSGPLNEPIPAHPDAIYRPQNRPMKENIRLATPKLIVSHVNNHNPVLAAPLTDGASGFSPWWIIGPLLGLLAILALAALAYFMKKKYDSDKQVERENNSEQQKTNDNLESLDNTEKSTVQNVTLRQMKPNIISNEQSTAKDISKPKLDANLNKKENPMKNKSQTNDFKKTHNEKTGD
ncbi:unnamed protein product [Rotaria sp. Silwood2]|nr:unnamed protein product [Rotaria sp. Silwood2]